MLVRFAGMAIFMEFSEIRFMANVDKGTKESHDSEIDAPKETQTLSMCFRKVHAMIAGAEVGHLYHFWFHSF